MGLLDMGYAGYQIPPGQASQMGLLWQSQNMGMRPNGTQKGNGWLGILRRPKGGVSTELSIGVNMDGKETLIPAIVPTLTHEELQWLLNNEGIPPQSIIHKAVDHAKKQIAAGRSPFKGE